VTNNPLGAPARRSKELASNRSKPVVRDKEATLKSILEAAELEFAQHGLRAARTEDIAATAGVAKGLIFYYFADKERLFEAVLEQAYLPVRSLFLEILSSSEAPRDLLQSLVQGVLQLMGDRPLAPSIVMLESIQSKGQHYRGICVPSFYETTEAVLAKGMKQGSFRKMDTKHAAINIMGLCAYYFCAANNFTDPGSDPDPFSEQELGKHSKEVLAFVAARTQVVNHPASRQKRSKKIKTRLPVNQPRCCF